MSSELLETYRLRYEAYCVERTFLRADDHPHGLETDEFDRFATHFATLDDYGQVVGTIRLVSPSMFGFPLFRHCTLFPDQEALYARSNSVVELSRLTVAAQQRPRGFGAKGALFSLYQAVYFYTKRQGITHWLMAAEQSLQRILVAYGFPFRTAGPTVDYWGPVAPYVLELAELDQILLRGSARRLNGFMDGLEDVVRPRLVVR
jgi:N-acyl-L-homoserine lactone synthetase